MAEAYVPPMPDAKTEEKPPFPRSTDKPKEFATGFGGKEKPAPKGRQTQSQKLESKLEELFSAISLPFLLAGDAHCAGIIAQGAPKMASAWVTLADENPGVKRVLTKLTEGSAWGGVILSTAAVAVPIAAHHGMPVGPLGQILGGPSSPAENRGRGVDSARPTQSGSAMGAPTPPPIQRDPIPQAKASDGYTPAGAPEGVVLVGARNRAVGANGANGAAATT